MGYEALVFLVWALAGFTAYVMGGWEPIPAERFRSVLTVRRAAALLAAAVGALVIVAVAIATVALPGELLYTVKRLIRSFAPQAILGLSFGFGFAIWLDHLMRTGALIGTKRTVAHIWGVALIVVFLGGIFMGPVNRILPRLSGISTPAVSLTFADNQDPINEPTTTTVQMSNSESRVSAISDSYLRHLAKYFERDLEYIRLLHGDPSGELEELHKSTREFIIPFANCVTSVIDKKKSSKDSSAIHADFGSALAAGTAWLRSVLRAEIPKAQEHTPSLSDMYNRLPPKCGYHAPMPGGAVVPDEAYKLPYFPLALAHLMQLAGYSSVGADLLAEWIDRSGRYSVTNAIPDWYRLRAYAHLSLLFGIEGGAVSRHAVLGQSVRLFEKVFQASSHPHLRDLRLWARKCAKHPNDDVTQLRFTFMTQSDSWVRDAIDSDQVTAALLPYVYDNEAIPVACYPALGPRDRDRWRARLLTTSGALLVALDSRARDTLTAYDDGRQVYRDARAYLVKALALLRPYEEGEDSSRRNNGAAAAIQPPVFHVSVAEAERYLRRTEQALGIR